MIRTPTSASRAITPTSARTRLTGAIIKARVSAPGWKIASPKWNFDDATVERTAASFNKPDHESIVIHNYRWRLGLAAGDPQSYPPIVLAQAAAVSPSVRR
jgi:hypothetical protein